MPLPRATYRLQLTPDFGFDAAAALVDYLAELGVSHLYASPSLQAAPGSTHGYDVVDPTRPNEELGGEAGHARLHRALQGAGLGQVLDIVPNHMWVGGPANRWWWDVLEKGPASRWADFFDITWETSEGDGGPPPEVLLPVLGDEPGAVIERGELKLTREAGAYRLRYFDHVFPVAEGTLPDLPDAGPEKLLQAVNDDPRQLEALLERQYYRLAWWRVASTEVNYRRFFHITQLAGLRIEDPRVQEETHALVYRWIHEGVLDGLRIDHPDGLRDPTGYLLRLRDEAPDAWVVVEKILEPGETLPGAWPVAGTTGYEFGNRVGGLFVDPEGEAAFTALYTELTGEPTAWRDLVHEAKMTVLEGILAADVEHLVQLFQRVLEARGRTEPSQWLRDALREAVASFPIYRTYLHPDRTPDPRDLSVIEEALGEARGRRRHLTEILELLRAPLLLEDRSDDAIELAMRFQQLTGPAMAKGVEDTAFYRFHRFVALNEVGGDPGAFGTAPEVFHRANREVQAGWPHALLGTSTHDSKRSEDVRARLWLLSEMPKRWGEAVRRWFERNTPHRGEHGPSANDEYLLYQTLVGAWPIGVERVRPFMEKSAREAKRATSWFDPDPVYERELAAFVEAVLGDPGFVAEVDAFVAPLVEPGRINGLSQTLLKLTSPGVPDLYQGCELWDLSLVDPDNRRPVDFEARRAALARLREGPSVRDLLRAWDEGLPKLHVIREALALRTERPEAFGAEGTYRPLEAEGHRAERVVAFVRGDAVVPVVPRGVWRLGGAFGAWRWEETVLPLPEGRWRDRLTGEVHAGSTPLYVLLGRFPVALLQREG